MDKVTDGLKHDGGKLRMDLVPPEIIEAVGAVVTHGAEKYGEGKTGVRLNQNGTGRLSCGTFARGFAIRMAKTVTADCRIYTTSRATWRFCLRWIVEMFPIQMSGRRMWNIARIANTFGL